MLLGFIVRGVQTVFYGNCPNWLGKNELKTTPTSDYKQNRTTLLLLVFCD
jgi:hypothetical protein